MDFFNLFSDYLLFGACLFILVGSVYLTFKTKFIQLRFLPVIFRMVKSSFSKGKEEESSHTITPYKALLTAMSTTLGIATIVGPVIAIKIGGPGSLIGFLLTAFFGSAATFTEVSLSVQYRQKLASGVIMGGPMQYLKKIFSPFAAKWYAVSCMALMMAWSSAQANQVAAILNSPLLGSFRIPTLISGLVISVLILITLMGGIKRIGSFSAKLVPVMFTLYLGSILWILIANVNQLGPILAVVLKSAWSPQALAGGAVVGGIVSSLRWGIFKGMQTTEAGVGTQAIPHAMAETKDPKEQGAISMVSTYCAGIIAFLSGLVTLVTNTWQDPTLPLGMSMVAASFQMYFSIFGIAIVVISALLFGFGTILGNSYNGSQCYSYLTDNRKKRYYLVATAIMIFFGSISEVKMIWSSIDIVLAFMVVPHMAALVYYAYKKPSFVKAEA